MKKMKLNIQLFATSCAVSITGITQDIENNCSTITVHGELTTSSSTYNHEGGAYMQPVISNQPVVGTQTSSQTLSKKKFSINTSSTKKLDWEFTVYHNSDGSCPTLTVKINWYATSNTNGTVTLSGGYTPATIPRASDVAATDGTLNVTNDVSITITRKNNNFTHTLRYVCGNASGWIKDSNNKVATSATWTPPISLANQNQSGDSVSCKIYCQTYNGSTAIGSETETTITLTIPTLNPTASLTTISDNTSYYSTYGAYIQNKSTIKSTLSGTAQYSTINTYYWEIRQNSTTGTLLASGDTTNITYTPTVSGTIYVIGTVTDKRGNSHSTSRNVSITAYKTPTCSLVVSRTNSTTASYTITGSGSPISVSGKTANVVNYVLKRDSTSIYSSSGSSLNRTSTDTIADQSYTYTLIAGDTISGNTDTKTVTISTTFTLMNFSNSGYGIAIGKASEVTGSNKLFEIAIPTTISQPLTLNSSVSGFKVNYIGDNTYSTAGDVTLYDRTLIDCINANRTAFFPGDKVYIEHSTNGGSSWTEYTTSSFSNDARKNVFSMTRGSALALATTTPVTSNMQCRVTLKYPGTQWYCSLDRLFIFLNKAGHTLKLDVEVSTYGAQSTYTKIMSDRGLDGWSGPNIISFGNRSAWGDNSSAHVYNIRLTFKITANSSYTTKIPSVNDIRFFGKNYWGSAGTPRYNGSLFTWDYNQNVNFPANVSSNGNRLARYNELYQAHPVGSIMITSTNSAPTIGGTWTLIDKEFSSTTGTTGYTRNTTNCTTVGTFGWVRSGHNITLTVNFTNKVAITDSTLTMFTLDFATLGITQLNNHYYGMLYSDIAKCSAFYQINATSGAFNTVDVIPDSQINANRDDIRTTISFNIPKEYMLDSACDKFYWKRTA